MTTQEISLIIAACGLVLSAIALTFNGLQTRRSSEMLQLNIDQARQTNEHLILDQQLARGNAVIYFTGRFFDLLKEGKGNELTEIINDPNWAYQFWSLHSTEFFFFQHGTLPRFIYTLWMIDLAKVYCCQDNDSIWHSHVKYLQTYSFNYPDMIEFFTEIHDMALKYTDENARNKQIWSFVEKWIMEHRIPMEA